MFGNKIADKITSVGKSKNKEKKDGTNEVEDIYIPPGKRQQIIDDLRLFHTKMEHQKITNLLGNMPEKVPRFITRKWIEVHDQSGTGENRYKPSKKIRFKTSMLRSYLCDYSDAYIVVTGDITVSAGDGAHNRSTVFKNNAPFTSCISKINGVLMENAEDLDIVMPMYNLLEYSKNYSETPGSLWNYYRDEPNNPPANNHDADPITNSESFKYKNSIIGKTPNNDNDNNNVIENVEIVVLLKHLSNFWGILDIPLINCEVSLTLTWSKNCVLTDIITEAADPNADPPVKVINAPRGATFKKRHKIVCSSSYFIS